jgi:hypothetical protein
LVVAVCLLIASFSRNDLISTTAKISTETATVIQVLGRFEDGIHGLSVCGWFCRNVKLGIAATDGFYTVQLIEHIL